MKGRDFSHRQQKVAGIINAVLVEVLRRGKMLDVRLMDNPLTITKVLVTPDLKVANCYFVPFNTNLKIIELLEALDASRYAIRNFVTKQINLKYSPEIRFHYDNGFDNAQIVEEILRKDREQS